MHRVVSGDEYAKIAQVAPGRWCELLGLEMEHTQLGRGVIEAVDPRKGNPLIRIQFDKADKPVTFNETAFLAGRISLYLPDSLAGLLGEWSSEHEKFVQAEQECKDDIAAKRRQLLQEGQRRRNDSAANLTHSLRTEKEWQEWQEVASPTQSPPNASTNIAQISSLLGSTVIVDGLEMQESPANFTQIGLENHLEAMTKKLSSLSCWLVSKKDQRGVWHQVTALGRYLKEDRSHDLSNALRSSKDEAIYPVVWSRTVSFALLKLVESMPGQTLVTIIPSKRGASQRLEKFMIAVEKETRNLSKELNSKAIFDFRQGIFGFSKSSKSNRSLDREQRFANIAHHMFVNNQVAAKDKNLIIIDDVTTSGATLIGAKTLIDDLGVCRQVKLLALASTP